MNDTLINPSVPNTPFLYNLKTSENRKVLCFQVAEKGCIGNEWVNTTILQNPLLK